MWNNLLSINTEQEHIALLVKNYGLKFYKHFNRNCNKFSQKLVWFIFNFLHQGFTQSMNFTKIFWVKHKNFFIKTFSINQGPKVTKIHFRVYKNVIFNQLHFPMKPFLQDVNFRNWLFQFPFWVDKYWQWVVIHVVSFEDPVLKSKMKFLENKFIS